MPTEELAERQAGRLVETDGKAVDPSVFVSGSNEKLNSEASIILVSHRQQ